MIKPEITFHDATAELVARYHDGRPPFTFQGWAAMIEDRVVGLGGIYFVEGVPYAFSEMNDELRARRRDLARCFRFLEERIGAFRGMVFAICSEPSSPRLLRRMGFVETGSSVGECPVMVRTWER